MLETVGDGGFEASDFELRRQLGQLSVSQQSQVCINVCIPMYVDDVTRTLLHC